MLVYAQNHPSLHSDRPGQTYNPQVLPPGTLQFQGGYRYFTSRGDTDLEIRDQNNQPIDFEESRRSNTGLGHFRIGLLSFLEFGLEGSYQSEDFESLYDASEPVFRVGESSFGLMPSLRFTLPARQGAAFHQGLLSQFEAVNRTWQLRWMGSYSGHKWGIAANLFGQGQADAYPLYGYTLNLAYGGQWGGFLEVFGQYEPALEEIVFTEIFSVHRLGFDAGLWWQFAARWQADLSLGWGKQNPTEQLLLEQSYFFLELGLTARILEA